MISEEVRTEILDRTDLVALIGRTVTLKKAGTLFKGCCPFHNERTPSFTVSPVRRTYHCFGCGVHGDALRFVMETQALSYPEALRQLAAECGVTVPESRRESPQERAARERQKSESERLLEIQDKVAAFYSDTLFKNDGTQGRAYLRDRRVGRAAAAAFRLGWASGDKLAFHDFATQNSFTLEDLALLGLVIAPEGGWQTGTPLGGGHLRFRRRVMFPVLDLRGDVVGFGGRVVDPDAKTAKYINSPETPIYTKGEHLYGIYQARHMARREGRVVLCEGNIDVIMAWQAGFEGTVAAMGTALTPKQVRLLKRLSEHVVCVMDGDAAGQKATFSSLLPFLEEGLSPRAVAMPAGDDPDSYLRKEGKAAFRALLDAAGPLLQAHIRAVAAAHPADPTGQAAALKALAPALGRIVDPLERSLYWKQAAEALAVEVALVEAAVQRASEKPEPPRRDRPAPPGQGHRNERPPVLERAPQAAPSARQPPTSESPSPFDHPGPFHDPGQPPPFHDSGPFFPPSEVAHPPPSRPPVRQKKPGFRPPPIELQVLGFICEFPHLIHDVKRLAGFESLTAEDLRAFFARLSDAVDRGETPSSERLIVELSHQNPEMQAEVEPLILGGPDHTPDQAGEALRQACRQLRVSYLKRRRIELGRALAEAGRSGEAARVAAVQLQLNASADELRRVSSLLALSSLQRVEEAT